MDQIEKFLSQYPFDFEHLDSLVGYDSQNFKVTTIDGQAFVLKVDQLTVGFADSVKKENEILLYLKDKIDFQITYPIKNIHGKFETIVDNKIARLLYFVHGEFWGDQILNNDQLNSLGSSIAKTIIELRKVDVGIIALKDQSWDLINLMDNIGLVNFVQDIEEKRLILYFFDQYHQFVSPHHKYLRKSLIHNDFNNWNVLMDKSHVIGLIDFGDMVYSAMINDLAIAMSYALCTSKDILEDSKTIITAFNKIIALKSEELDVLYLLIAGRMITSLVNSAKGKAENPDNEYISVNAKLYKALLKKWIQINPIGFKKTAYEACDIQYNSNEQQKNKIDQIRTDHFGSNLSLSYEEPIFMSSSAFQYMYDLDGNTYLDAYNNIPLVGHSHPLISKAISDQVRILNTNTRYHYTELGDYANKLLSFFPSHLNKVFFVNSGSAASDLAIRLAKTHTQREDIYVLEEGYHGNTQTGIQISHYKHSKKGGNGRSKNIHHFPLPKTFNSEHDAEYFIDDALKRIDKYYKEKIIPAAFIAEPISGCGGQVPLPPSYLSSIYEKIKSYGGLCVSDEVQTGFGRLGSHFWGFEMHNVLPDIVLLGKPIGNGHPIGAVVCSSEIADSFDNGMEFFSSFGGNPVSCRVGKEVLNILESEQLQRRAKEVGQYWKDELHKLQQEFPLLADIRGSGLFIGIEILEDNKPGTRLANRIKNKMKNNFVLTSTDGKYNNVIKVKPPLCFNEDNVDHFCLILKKCCDEIKEVN